jgi:DNA sulfur modification protein DndD
VSDSGIDLPEAVPALLIARSTVRGAGNRRALFAKFDEFLAGSIGHCGDGDPEIRGAALSSRPPVVRLNRIRLRNWRSFERAELNFDDGGPGRPLFIVGGRNGFGKSSILEAFAFGLFGRRVLADLAPLIGGTASRGTLKRSYAQVMSRILHRSQRGQAEGACAVRLDFDTPDGPFQIERKWYFDEIGALIEGDEEVFVHVGSDRQLLRAPVDANPLDWLQDEIERYIMPAGLAPFFVFDGEQIERWADRKLSDQVRLAIERVLGLEDLAGLADDLRAYSKDRERASGSDGVEDVERVGERVGRLREAMQVASERLQSTRSEILQERGRRESVLVSLAVATGTHAEKQASLERAHALDMERGRLRRELAAVVSDLGPLAMVGRQLITKVADQVEEEGVRASTAELGRAGLEGLWSRFVNLEPALDASVSQEMRLRLEKAWKGNPQADARPAIHLHLGGTDHRLVAARLRSAGGDAVEIVTSLRADLQRVDAEHAGLMIAKAEEEYLETGRVEARRELAEIAERLEKAEERRREIEREISLLEASLEPDVRELARLEERIASVAPKARGAAAARKLAEEIGAWISARSAAEYDRFAAAVSDSFRSLSHKDQITRVTITRDGTVALFDASGVDVTDYRLSAGESQLFALSLIAAVAVVTGRDLPLIVDTPLSRLDSEHRAGVMKMLMGRGGQTILLTQPEEIGHRHMSALEPAIAGTVSITHRISKESGVGVSDFTRGYLEDVAA